MTSDPTKAAFEIGQQVFEEQGGEAFPALKELARMHAADNLREAVRNCSGHEPSISLLYRTASESADEIDRLWSAIVTVREHLADGEIGKAIYFLDREVLPSMKGNVNNV